MSAPVMDAASEQPASRSGIRTVFSGRQDLRRLRHEVDAGQHDDVGVGLRPLLGQGQRVAHDVGDAVEDLRRLVVVGQDDGVAFCRLSSLMAAMYGAWTGHSRSGITERTFSWMAAVARATSGV